MRAKYVSGVLLAILLVTSIIAIPSFIITTTSQTASANPSSGTFTIVALPDAQNYSQFYPLVFENQTEWIVQNENRDNIVFVTGLGDSVNDWNVNYEWENANNAYSILDNKVPYTVLAGNHDMENGSLPPLGAGAPYYEKYLPASRYENYSYWGGSYDSTSAISSSPNMNNYQLFSWGGMDFITLSLQYDPPADVLSWADNVLSRYSDRRAIISTHSYLARNGDFTTNSDGSSTTNGGENIYQSVVVPENNVFLVLCGHADNYGTMVKRTDNLGGRLVYQLLSDYQDLSNGGNGYLRIMEFVPSESAIYVKTYSPYLDNYMTDSTNQFVLSYPMTVSISPPSQSGLNGSTLTYNVTINNKMGSGSDNYFLTVTDSENWSPSVLPTSLVVSAFGSGTATLSVTVPSGAAGGTPDSINVTATSQRDNTVSGSASCTANALNPGWWNSNWSYRRAITISPLNPENYQIKVIIPSDIPTNDYPSIRFLENETSGVLPYWIEKNENSAAPPNVVYKNVAWVRRLENDDNTIFMYYHNPGATSAENGDNTFLFWDDFGGGNGGQDALNKSKWGPSSTGVDVTVAVLRLQNYGSSDAFVEHGPGQNITTNEEENRRVIEFRIKDTSVWRGGVSLTGPSISKLEAWGIYPNGGNAGQPPRFFSNGNWGSISLPTGVWYVGNIIFYGDNATNKNRIRAVLYWGNDNANYRQLVENDLPDISQNWAPSGGSTYIDKYKPWVWDGGGNDTYYYDWFFVRKSVYGISAEPVATVGSSQYLGVSTSISPTSQSGANGATLTYAVTVNNIGNVDDNYTISVTDNAGWSPSILPILLSVPAGNSENATLSVAIPSNAIGGTIDNITITATSQTIYTVSASVSCTAQVTGAPVVLSVGWNLVEFTAVDNVNDTPINVFPGLTYLSDFTIFWYKVGAGYQLQAGTVPFMDNTGYFVNINQTKTVTTSGLRPASRNVILSVGWNMVSFPIDNASSTPINTFPGLTYLADFTIFWYKVGAGYQLQAGTAPFKDNTGYFVNINQDWTVIVPYGVP